MRGHQRPPPSSPGVPRRRPSQEGGMEELRLGTWVSIMDSAVRRYPHQARPQRREEFSALQVDRALGRGWFRRAWPLPVVQNGAAWVWESWPRVRLAGPELGLRPQPGWVGWGLHQIRPGPQGHAQWRKMVPAPVPLPSAHCPPSPEPGSDSAPLRHNGAAASLFLRGPPDGPPPLGPLFLSSLTRPPKRRPVRPVLSAPWIPGGEAGLPPSWRRLPHSGERAHYRRGQAWV